MFATQLPKDLHLYLISEVIVLLLVLRQFVGPREIVNIFCLSKYFHQLSTDPLLWHSLYKTHYFYKPFDKSVDWRSNFTTAWINEHSNQWEDGPETRDRRYYKGYEVQGKVVTQRQNATYLPIRTKFGYSSGVHCWEVTPLKNQSGCYNTYIGVSTADLDLNWYLGKKNNGWGLKGSDGLFHHDSVVVANSKTFDDDDKTYNKKKSYFNDKPVTLRLDMDNCVLDYFVKGVHVLSYKEEKWRVFREVNIFDISREKRYILQDL